jgi:ribosomal protein L7/L12
VREILEDGRFGRGAFLREAPVSDADRDILELIEAGQKIRAIKLAREHLGMGLAEAKAFVEGLQDELKAGRTPGPEAFRRAPAPAEPSPGPAADHFDHELDSLLRARKKIDAVKLYRQRAGGDLKDAKDAVELRAVEIGLQSRPSKCFIATAAWGGGEQAEVAALRRFRNRVLRRRWWGRALVRGYERVSPALAVLVCRSGLLAWLVRVAIRCACAPVLARGRGGAAGRRRGG